MNLLLKMALCFESNICLTPIFQWGNWKLSVLFQEWLVLDRSIFHPPLRKDRTGNLGASQEFPHFSFLFFFSISLTCINIYISIASHYCYRAVTLYTIGLLTQRHQKRSQIKKTTRLTSTHSHLADLVDWFW